MGYSKGQVHYKNLKKAEISKERFFSINQFLTVCLYHIVAAGLAYLIFAWIIFIILENIFDTYIIKNDDQQHLLMQTIYIVPIVISVISMTIHKIRKPDLFHIYKYSKINHSQNINSKSPSTTPSVRTNVSPIVKHDQHNEAIVPEPMEEVTYKEHDLLKCPRCGSTAITANQKGYSLGKATTGLILTGGIGLLAGFIGKNKIKITCLKCGNSWKPGKPTVW